jgi:putative oxidoreductase
MSHLSDRALLWSGAATATGGLLHIAIIFGGPDWYQFFGAPPSLVQMARDGHPRAAISCVAIASVLFAFAAYAFSGAGVIRRLPLLRTSLFLIGGGLLMRGILFVPIAVWYPRAVARICDCNGADTFAVTTSAICLIVGLGYTFGAFGVSRLRDGVA